LAAGPIIGMYGAKFFPWVVAGLICFFVACFLMILAGAMTWTNSTLGFILCLAVSIAVGCLAGWFAKKLIKLSMLCLGGFCGFFVGSMIFTLIL